MNKKDAPIAIESINLDIAGQKLTLTLDQARELKRALDGLFVQQTFTYPWYISPLGQPTTTCGAYNLRLDKEPRRDDGPTLSDTTITIA